MSQPDRNISQQSRVRQADVKDWLTAESMSPLGRDLMKIANEIEASDEHPMDEDDFERELVRRRGGYSLNGE